VSLPERREVWLADLGAAAKIRPVLVVSVPYSDLDYALIEVVPHTTQKRGGQFEVHVSARGLEEGVFNIQGMLAVPSAKFLHKVSALSPSEMVAVETIIKKWLGLRST
jgi:mRNA interferase MazF